MSQIATTIEQSKLLLEAGLRPDTADMVWYKAVNGKFFLTVHGETPFWESPAWSLSALWDIMKKAGVIYDYATCDEPDTVIDSLVAAVCRLAKQGRIVYDG